MGSTSKQGLWPVPSHTDSRGRCKARLLWVPCLWGAQPGPGRVAVSPLRFRESVTDSPSCLLSTPGSYYAIKRETHLHLLRLLTRPSKERCGLGRTLRGPGGASRPTLMLLVPEGSEVAFLNRLKWGVFICKQISLGARAHPSRGLSPRRRASSTQGGGAINKTPKAIRGGGGMFYS